MHTNLHLKGINFQLKNFKETDVFWLLKLGPLLLITRVSEIFLLNLLFYYSDLSIVKSSRVTRT